MAKAAGDLAGPSLSLVLFESIDQRHGGKKAVRFVMLDGLHAKRGGDVRLAGTGRSSVIVPGVWDQKCGSRIRIIHDAARRWRCWEASGMRAQATSLFASLTGRCSVPSWMTEPAASANRMRLPPRVRSNGW